MVHILCIITLLSTESNVYFCLTNNSTEEYSGLQSDLIRSSPTVSLKCTRDIAVSSTSGNFSIIEL